MSFFLLQNLYDVHLIKCTSRNESCSNNLLCNSISELLEHTQVCHDQNHHCIFNLSYLHWQEEWKPCRAQWIYLETTILGFVFDWIRQLELFFFILIPQNKVKKRTLAMQKRRRVQWNTETLIDFSHVIFTFKSGGVYSFKFA